MNQKYALIAGISLIIMAIAAGFAYGHVYGSLVIKGDEVTTFNNIKTSRSMFIQGIGGWIVILTTDLLVSWALYAYFIKIDKNLSLITAAIRVSYTLILGVAIYQLFTVLPLLTGSEIKSISTVSVYLKSFESLWSIGLIIFGVHLVGLGLLAFRAKPLPNFFSYLLVFAGVCYTLIHLGKNIAPNYATQIQSIELILSLPMALSEIGLAIWLLIRGKQMEAQANI